MCALPNIRSQCKKHLDSLIRGHRERHLKALCINQHWQITLVVTIMRDWDNTKVIAREQNRHPRWIREAIHIRREGGQALNRDEGLYKLPHLFDTVIALGNPPSA